MSISDIQWYLPSDYKPGKDRSQRYIVSEIQLRKLFALHFNPLDFNRDFVKEFIKQEKLKHANSRKTKRHPPRHKP